MNRETAGERSDNLYCCVGAPVVDDNQLPSSRRRLQSRKRLQYFMQQLCPVSSRQQKGKQEFGRLLVSSFGGFVRSLRRRSLALFSPMGFCALRLDSLQPNLPPIRINASWAEKTALAVPGLAD